MNTARRSITTSALRSSSRSLTSLCGATARPSASLSLFEIANVRASPLPRWAPTAAFHSSPFRLSQDTTWASKGNVSYSELKPITEAPTGEITIIDVREPDEVSAGMIPSAVNVPLTQFEKAFNRNKGADFQQQFSFPRPGFNDKIIFYCRSGKRSDQALQMAKKNGWQNARNYTGSWLDWVQHEEGKK